MSEAGLLQMIDELTRSTGRIAVLSEFTMELLKITGERVDVLEQYQTSLSFEDMVDGKTLPKPGFTAEHRIRLEELEAKLSAAMKKYEDT